MKFEGEVLRDLPAGPFSAWLRHVRSALLAGGDTFVDCGECTACCTSSLFIHVRPDETGTLNLIPRDLLFAAPGQAAGNVLLGYDERGVCPMLRVDTCSIYSHRPRTCREYDCRVFAAADISPGEGRALITERARRWRFDHPSECDRREHRAVRAAAAFIRDHASSFPGGRVPSDPSQLAILAVKSYQVFLHEEWPAGGGAGSPDDERSATDGEVADAVVRACREFDARMSASALKCGGA